jgi:hypothetical protein
MSGSQRGHYVELNGQSLLVYADAKALRQIPATNLWVNLEYVTIGELSKAASLPGAYDYALPQDWFNEYLARKGEAPRGVWWYPPKEDKEDGKYWLGGRFMGVPELLERVGKALLAAGEAPQGQLY